MNKKLLILKNWRRKNCFGDDFDFKYEKGELEEVMKDNKGKMIDYFWTSIFIRNESHFDGGQFYFFHFSVIHA